MSWPQNVGHSRLGQNSFFALSLMEQFHRGKTSSSRTVQKLHCRGQGFGNNLLTEADMDRFEKGDRVKRIDTGDVGTVRRQFEDGYVSLDLDSGRPAQLDAASLTRIDKSATSSDQ
jgi:hypothetical protein